MKVDYAARNMAVAEEACRRSVVAVNDRWLRNHVIWGKSSWHLIVKELAAQLGISN